MCTSHSDKQYLLSMAAYTTRNAEGGAGSRVRARVLRRLKRASLYNRMAGLKSSALRCRGSFRNKSISKGILPKSLVSQRSFGSLPHLRETIVGFIRAGAIAYAPDPTAIQSGVVALARNQRRRILQKVVSSKQCHDILSEDSAQEPLSIESKVSVVMGKTNTPISLIRLIHRACTIHSFLFLASRPRARGPYTRPHCQLAGRTDLPTW